MFRFWANKKISYIFELCHSYFFLGGQGDGGGHDGRGGGHTTSSSRNNGFHNGEGQPPGPGHRETGIIEKLLVSVFWKKSLKILFSSYLPYILWLFLVGSELYFRNLWRIFHIFFVIESYLSRNFQLHVDLITCFIFLVILRHFNLLYSCQYGRFQLVNTYKGCYRSHNLLQFELA